MVLRGIVKKILVVTIHGQCLLFLFCLFCFFFWLLCLLFLFCSLHPDITTKLCVCGTWQSSSRNYDIYHVITITKTNERFHHDDDDTIIYDDDECHQLLNLSLKLPNDDSDHHQRQQPHGTVVVVNHVMTVSTTNTNTTSGMKKCTTRTTGIRSSSSRWYLSCTS